MAHIFLSKKVEKDLDEIKKEINAESRPETIRFLIRMWKDARKR